MRGCFVVEGGVSGLVYETIDICVAVVLIALVLTHACEDVGLVCKLAPSLQRGRPSNTRHILAMACRSGRRKGRKRKEEDEDGAATWNCTSI